MIRRTVPIPRLRGSRRASARRFLASARSRSRGLNLIEILIAMFLLAIALLGIAPVFLTGMKSNALGWDHSMMNQLAKERLEQTLQYGFNDARLRVPAGSTIVGLQAAAVPGKVFQIDTPGNYYPGVLDSTGLTLFPYPYIRTYFVQYFRLEDIPLGAGGSLPNPASAQTEGATWTANPGVKVITVIVASSRKFLGGKAGYATNIKDPAGTIDLTPFQGKQVRVSFMRAS